jgi:hypothetical protein
MLIPTKNCASPTRNKKDDATTSTIFSQKGKSQTKQKSHKRTNKFSLPPLTQKKQKTEKAKQIIA